MVLQSAARQFGFYISGVGVIFLLAGAAFFFNYPLLIVGNLLVLAGLVFVVGLTRTKTFWRIFQQNRCCGRGLWHAAVVALVGGVLPCVVDYWREKWVVGWILRLPGLAWICDKIQQNRMEEREMAAEECKYCRTKRE